MQNLSTHAKTTLNEGNPFKNFKIENYKYAQLQKDEISNKFLEIPLNMDELFKISHKISNSDFNTIDLNSKIDDWKFNCNDSYFRVASLTKRSSVVVNLDAYDQEILFLDINEFEENIQFLKKNTKFQTLVLLTSNSENKIPRSIFFELEANSNLDVLQISLSNKKSFLYFEIIQSDFSKMNFLSFQSNNNHIRNEYYASLGEQCYLNLSGLNFKNHLINDNYSFIQHMKPSTSSSEVFKSIVNNGAITNFQGKIYVDSIAQKTDGYQMSRSLLLDNVSKANNKPELEIYADDVKCSHGSTVSKIDQDQIYYFNTRGINKEDALKILQKAFVSEVLEPLQNEGLKSFSFGLLDSLI